MIMRMVFIINTYDALQAIFKVKITFLLICRKVSLGNDSNLLIVFYVQIVPDDFVMQLHRF